MSAWTESVQEDNINCSEKAFEDDFVSPENSNDFKKLEDSDDYLKLLGKFIYSKICLPSKLIIVISLESRLKKIRKDPSVLQQLKEKREECLNNLLNTSYSLRSEQDFELEESVKSNEIIRHLLPAQAQTLGEIAHLIQHDQLDQQKQEVDEANQEEQSPTN